MYPQLISPFLARLIAQNNHHPALLSQFTYDPREEIISPDETPDPLDEAPATVAPNLLHRYPHKALWLVNNTCTSNCRFCFRKLSRPSQSPLDIPAVVHYLKTHSAINELIFSGGEPLLLPFSTLSQIVSKLISLQHLTILRFHTRLPLFSPQLITADLFSLWSSIIKQGREVVIVLHLNHPLELTPQLKTIVTKMNDLSIKVKAQGVLLKGVNDSAQTLATLWREELAAGIEPYYLHHLDHICGTSHFRLSLEEGLDIYQSALKLFSNPSHQPKYILDLGREGKREVKDLARSLTKIQMQTN
ncbi:hypothetical protein FWH30_03615 [Microgenomates group bacterium]|nr:hypothetical protein [Microgenomates group bacterium]